MPRLARAGRNIAAARLRSKLNPTPYNTAPRPRHRHTDRNLAFTQARQTAGMIRALALLLLLSGCSDAAGQSPFCAAVAPPPQPYCTRTLGRVECWANPEALPGPPPEVADGARALTAAQRADCHRRWPGW